MKWRIYVESTRYLQVKHPEWEGGFSETRKSAPSWMRRSAVIKHVTVLKSWSNLCFETERFLGFGLWTESTTTWPKRQETFLLKALSTELQGNLLRRQSHNQSLLWHCVPILFLFVKKLYRHQSIQRDSVKIVLSKVMISLRRHNPSIPREDDGAVRFDDTMPEFKAKFEGTSQCASTAWITFLAKEEDRRKGSNIVWTLTLPNTSCISEQFRDIQVVISLILHYKTMYCCQMTSPSTSTTSER